MTVYAPDATFVTRTGLVQGRAAIVDHHRSSFTGGRNFRGRLSFVHVLVFARYHLNSAEAEGTAEDGPTTLLFERRRGGWRIVADHSS